MTASRLAVDLARKAADAADRNLGLVADNFTLGRVSLVDLIDAQTNALNLDVSFDDEVLASYRQNYRGAIAFFGAHF